MKKTCSLKKIIVVSFLYSSFNLLCKDVTVDDLTLMQKIGQLFMVAAVADETIAQACIQKKDYRMDKEYITILIQDYHIGGIIYLGASEKEKQIERTRYFQSISTIPLLIGQDLEPGRIGASRLPGFCNFDSNQELGRVNNEECTKNIGHEIGKICTTLGVHINFAPVADVNNNPDNQVISDRAFGNEPALVTQHSIAFAQGLSEYNIVGCAKHFPGHGDTNTDSHHDLPVINHTKERLYRIELHPFIQLIKNNIPAIMIGHICVPAFEPEEDLPATLSKAIITELLQNELGFSGLIITDALDMGAITKHYSPGQAALKAFMAGNDILLCPVNIPDAVNAIKQAVTDNIITEQDINIRVEKILKTKQQCIY